MPTSAEAPPDLLLDTSVAIAIRVPGHEGRASAVRAVKGLTIGLAGHAAFETFSVLTRLPAPARRRPAAASRMIAANFPRSRFLSSRGAGDLLDRLRTLGIAGGAVYDALVGATAAEHGVPLLTRDARALRTYRALNIEVTVID